MFGFDDEDKENPIGSLLRFNREQKELNLDDIAEKLKVRPEYLAAMEQGRFELLPAGFYRRSFLKAYAEYLKLDADQVLKMLEVQEGASKKGEGEAPIMPTVRMEGALREELTDKERVPQMADLPPEPLTRENPVGYWFLVFLGLLIGAACLVFLFNLGIREDQKISASPVEAESLVVIPEPPDTMKLFADLLDRKIGTAPELILRLEASGRTWIRVTSDGVELYSGFINQNMRAEFKAKESLSVNLGVNEGVRAFLNRFEIKPLEEGVTYLNRENFEEFIPTDRANEIVREHE
jgi:transcriptional regulator with XRE-family HTH domain